MSPELAISVRKLCKSYQIAHNATRHVTLTEAMLDRLCARPLIEKTRYKIAYKGLTWEVDEFFGANQGLTVAEVELKSENESIALPEWVDREVTGDPKYYNANLIAHPYTTW